MRPNPLIVQRYVVRGMLLWVGVRAIVSAVAALAGTDPLHLTPALILMLVGGSVALGVVDVLRRHERALLENLAVSRTALVAFLAGPAMLGELAIVFVANARG